MKSVRRIYGILESVWSSIVLLSLVGMFAALILMVFTRYVLARPLAGGDEVSQLLFIWLVFVGAIVPVKDGDMISMDFIIHNFLPRRFQRVVRIVHDILFMIVSVFFVKGAYVAVVKTRWGFSLNVTGIPWKFVYLAGFVFFVSSTLVCAWRVYGMIRSNRAEPF